MGYDKQLFCRPPENPKEAVVCAANALQRGDWLAACKSLDTLKLWSHVNPGNPDAGAIVKTMIKETIQAEGLSTYPFAHASIYDAFHLDKLVDMLGFPFKKVHSIISKMMINEKITTSWDAAH